MGWVDFDLGYSTIQHSAWASGIYRVCHFKFYRFVLGGTYIVDF